MQKIFHVGLALAVVMISVASPLAASAASAGRAVISEVQTGTVASASQEFVELYNPVPNDVTVDGWTVEYKSATSTDTASSWTKHATLAGTIKGYGFYLVAPLSYLPQADADWAATLAGSGAPIRYP